MKTALYFWAINKRSRREKQMQSKLFEILAALPKEYYRNYKVLWRSNFSGDNLRFQVLFSSYCLLGYPRRPWKGPVPLAVNSAGWN